MSRSVPSWLPDGRAELLDDVVSEVLEHIQSCHHLVVVEGFRHSLAKQEYSLKHINSGLADPSLNGNSILWWVPVAVFIFIFVSDSQLVRVHTLNTPSLLTSFKGFKLSARHQHILPGLGAQSIGISLSPHPRFGISRRCEGQVRSSWTTFVVSRLCNGSRGSMVCAGSCAAVYPTWV